MTKRPLLSLAESNKRATERRAAVEFLRTHGTPNGIACPQCGAELHDIGATWSNSLGSWQPYRCHACGVQGVRQC
jgi:transposase-like protein